MSDRIQRRIEKEKIERERRFVENRPAREERYRKIEKLLLDYDEECRTHPYELTSEARHIWNHILDEYSHDLVLFSQRTRKGKSV